MYQTEFRLVHSENEKYRNDHIAYSVHLTQSNNITIFLTRIRIPLLYRACLELLIEFSPLKQAVHIFLARSINFLSEKCNVQLYLQFIVACFRKKMRFI